MNDTLTPTQLRPGGGLSYIADMVQGLQAVRTAVVHPCNELTLSAALEARHDGFIEPILIGPLTKIRAIADESGIDLTGVECIDAPHSHAAADIGAGLAARGEAEAMMKGSLHTDELLQSIVPQQAGLRTKRRISHCFVLRTPAYPRSIIVTDAAINIAPDLLQKADIARNAIDLARSLGVDLPRLAVLAAVEVVNPAMQATLDAAALCKMADRGQIVGGLIDGPLAFDNAISAEAAQTKGIVSEVAGQADILLVPDLESGNMLAKQLMYLGGADSAGILLGAKVPVVLTSRADSRETRLASCAIAVRLAHQYRTTPP